MGLAMYASLVQAVKFFQMCIDFGAVQVVHFESSYKHLTLRVALNKSSPRLI